MVQLTNVVCMTQLQCELDLKHLASITQDVEYNPHKHNCLIWRHKKIRGCCMLSKHGIMMCNGAAISILEAKRRVRRYARMVQKAGYPVHLSIIRVVTMSAVHAFSHPLNLIQIAKELEAQYEPELFNGVRFKRDGINFTCFTSGKMIMVGIKKISHIEHTILPCIIELELL